MAVPVTPMTKLEAVNEILYDIGERPVNTLTGATRLDVIRAIATIERITRDLCTTGYWWNREKTDVSPNGSGQYVIPAAWVRVLVVEPDQDLSLELPVVESNKWVVRSGFLYDTRTQTNSGFSGDVTVIFNRLLEFEQLPETARAYVYARASSIFTLRSIGATALASQLGAQADALMVAMKQEDLEQDNFNVAHSPRMRELILNR